MPVAAGGRILASTINTIMLSANEKAIVRLLASATQNLTNNTITPLAFAAEDVDTSNIHDIVTNNSRITPIVGGAGWWEFDGACFFPTRTDWQNVNVFVRFNGVTNIPSAARLAASQPGGAWSLNVGPTMVLMNGTTDYVELMAQQSNTGAATVATVNGGFQTNTFSGRFIRPA